jgi:hypothetical protein
MRQLKELDALFTKLSKKIFQRTSILYAKCKDGIKDK